jgi:hypothetical protein
MLENMESNLTEQEQLIYMNAVCDFNAVVKSYLKIVRLANKVYKHAKPLAGEEYDVLDESWLKSLKQTSKIKGML